MADVLAVRNEYRLQTWTEIIRECRESGLSNREFCAQQSIREGGMPFTPSLKAWDELTQDEIDARLRKSMADVSAGRVLSQDQLDAKMRERFARG